VNAVSHEQWINSLFVVRISDGFKVLDVAPDAANVFRWAVSPTFNTQRIPTTTLGFQASFKNNFVFPAVAEVVLVQEAEPLAILRNDLADLRDGRINALKILETVVDQPIAVWMRS
jgi:hypothetical protein